MNRTGWTVVLTAAIGGLGLFGLPRALNAENQSARPARVGSVDVGKVFQEYQRKKDLDEELKEAQQRMEKEMESRRNQIDSFQAMLDALSQDDPTYAEKTRQLLQMQIEYKNWLDMSQADVSREVALWTARVYKDILDMIAEIAQQEGYDVVLYHDTFTPRGSDPQVIREQIASRKVVYVSPAADLTQLILDALNARYRSEPRRKMLNLGP